MSTSPVTSASASALSAQFGLLAWLDETRIALPLKGVEARFEAAGEVAHVEIDQIYHQTADRPLDCVYSFPLPAESAVHQCEIHINGRVIRARIEELQQAYALYHQAKQSGHRAALVDSQRSNFFTLNLANVQPGDLVVVRLGYVQTLERLGDERRLRIPFCPGIRYIPGQPLLRPNLGRGTSDDTLQVPDASRITPPRIDALHPDAAYLAVQGTLKVAAGDLDRILTQSHRLTVSHQPAEVAVTLDSRDALPDQDFLLGWTLTRPQETTPRAWISQRDGTRYALLELRAPASAKNTPRQPVDVYFVLDRSGSMEGQNWEQACTALDTLRGQLSPADRIQIITFDTSHSLLTETPVSVEKSRALWPLAALHALGIGGGTNLLPALGATLAAVDQHSVERKPIVVLLTDGQVGNEAEIVASLRGHPKLVLHAFGIDMAVNDCLLTSITRQQRGQCFLLRSDENIPAALQRLGSLLSHPVLTDLETPPGWETANGPLPDLYCGETATALVRCPGNEPLTLTAKNPLGVRIPVGIDSQPTLSPAVALLWARRRIADLENRGRIPECLPLAREFNLLCRGAAFVAWDEQEKVAIADQEVLQPSLTPAGQFPAAAMATRMGLTSFCDRSDEPMTLGASELPSFSRFPSVGLFAAQPEERFWYQNALFDEPGADRLYRLLETWINGETSRRRHTLSLRLTRLVEQIAELPGTPSDHLRALVQSLPSLIGTHGRTAEQLKQLCLEMGWA
jgi:Ca-activated chloride channel homolog